MSKKVTRKGAAEVVSRTWFNITAVGIAKLPIPYQIMGRDAVYDEAEVLEYTRQMLRSAPVQRAAPRQLACKRVLAELARRAAQP